MEDNDAAPDFHEKRLTNRVAAVVGFTAALFFLINMTFSFFPGMSARLTAVALGLEPRLSPSHPLWMLLTFPARLLPPQIAVTALNLWSLLCGVFSVALLYRYLSRWIHQRIVLDAGLSERSIRLAALSAAGVAAVAFATSAPLIAASTRLHLASFHILLILISFNLLQDNIDAKDRWRPFILAFLCGAGCTESVIFLVMTPYFAFMQLVALYKRQEASWARFTGLLLAGALGGSLYILAAAQFAGTPAYELAGYPSRKLVVFQMIVNQLAELKGMFAQTGWIWVLLMVFAPWLAIQFEARYGLNRRRDVATVIFNVVLILLVLPVQFNSGVLPWSESLPEGRLPVLEMLLTAMTAGYLMAFWSLRFLEPVELYESESSNRKRDDLKKADRAMQRTAGILACGIAIMILSAAARNISISGSHGGRFAEKYAAELLDQLDGADWLVTGGTIDTLVRLAARERGMKLHVVDLARERDPVQRRALCRIIGHDPDFKERLPAHLNSARIGCATFFKEWLTSDTNAVHRVAFYTSPDLLYEAGYQVVPDRLVFRGVTGMEQAKDVSLLDRHRPFWDKMDDRLAGQAAGSPLATLRATLRRHVSMTANNLGVFLEDIQKPGEAYTAYGKALEFDSENFSALLNRVVLSRRNINPLDAEKNELEAAEMLNKIKGRPGSGHLSRYYGYVRVPGEFARLGFEWLSYGRPEMAESSLKRAISITPLSQRSTLLEGLAEIHFSNNELDQSEAAFRQILDLFPRNVNALLGMLRICVIRHNAQSAYEWLQKAADAGCDTRRLELERAKIEIVEKRYADAQRRLQTITDLDPNNIEAWACQGNLLLLQKDLVPIEKTILPRMKKISMDKPRYETALIEAYLNLAKSGRTNLINARENFLLALRLKPGSRSLLSEIVKIDYALSDMASAQQHASALLRIDRDDPSANYVMGSILVSQEDFAGAEEHLRRAVSASPSSSNCNDLAEVLRMQNKLAEAENFARKSLELDQRNPFAYDTLACILLELGDVDEALAMSLKARDIAPEELPFKLTEAKILLAKDNRVEARVLIHDLNSKRARVTARQQTGLDQISAGRKNPE